jgi:hypothetical protein
MFDFRAMVRALAEHDLQFAIVGGMAGVMQSATMRYAHVQKDRKPAAGRVFG